MTGIPLKKGKFRLHREIGMRRHREKQAQRKRWRGRLELQCHNHEMLSASKAGRGKEIPSSRGFGGACPCQQLHSRFLGSRTMRD